MCVCNFGKDPPVGSYIETRIYVDADGIRTKSSMSALPFTFMMCPHIMFHETSHIKPHEIDHYWYWPFAKRMHARTVERTHDRTNRKYTRSLVLPSWRHETWSGATCEGIIHTLLQELYAKGALCGPVGTYRAPIGALCGGSSMRLYTASYFLEIFMLVSLVGTMIQTRTW